MELSAPNFEIQCSYKQDKKFKPLGKYRLRCVELIFQILKLNKEPLLTALAESGLLEMLVQLVHDYPWNNFLQLKVKSIFEEILDNENLKFREDALKKSGIVQQLIKMGDTPMVILEHSG